ncbi:hypothetical protein LLE87_38125, partial [Paenibacillus polymyxa]|nr:hypothetical protein [Paenibacillus polymyxa]
RRLYSERREATAAALSSVLGNRLRIDPQPGGMHLVARLDGHQTDRELAARMLRQDAARQLLRLLGRDDIGEAHEQTGARV